jgi:hypothetical protein
MVGLFTVSADAVPARGAQAQWLQSVSLRWNGPTDTPHLPVPAAAAGDSAPRGSAAQDTDVTPSWFFERGEREEQAQRLARHSIELAGRSEVDEIGKVALELMRMGNHDPATLQHALVMCRSLSRGDPSDERMKRAIRLLQHVTTFLGVPPRLFDARHLPAADVARVQATAGPRL